MNNQQELFFIVGAQRSGTTYLYTVLDEHPEICMAKPLKPEPKYFLNKSTDKFNRQEYFDSYYTHSTEKTKVFGEKSTSYYENESVAKYISANLPTAKIIFILADPVSRAISNYKFSVDNGLETRGLEEALVLESEIPTDHIKTSVNPFAYKERGVYLPYLNSYYRYFPKENIKIIIKEQFTNNQEAIQDLYTFLGVDSRFKPESINTVINKSKNSIDSEEEKRVREHLSAYYQEHNKALADTYDLDISVWR